MAEMPAESATEPETQPVSQTFMPLPEVVEWLDFYVVELGGYPDETDLALGPGPSPDAVTYYYSSFQDAIQSIGYPTDSDLLYGRVVLCRWYIRRYQMKGDHCSIHELDEGPGPWEKAYLNTFDSIVELRSACGFSDCVLEGGHQQEYTTQEYCDWLHELSEDGSPPLWQIVENHPDAPSRTAYRQRFGSLTKAREVAFGPQSEHSETD